MPKASDFSKRIKAQHLGDEPRTLTIGQVGVEKMQKRNKQDIVIFASSEMQSPDEIKFEQVVYLWFREFGATRNMRVNETNLNALIAARGDNFKDWIDCKITVSSQEIFAFGKKQKTIVIESVKPPAPKATKPPSKVNTETDELTDTDTGSDVEERAPLPETTLPPQPPIPSKQNGSGAMSKDKFFTYAKEQNAVSLAQEIANRHAKNPDWDKSFAELNDLLAARNAQQD